MDLLPDDTVKTNVRDLIHKTKEAMVDVTKQLDTGGGHEMKKKLDEVDKIRKKAEESEIELSIKDKMGDLTDKIAKITEDVNKQIEEKFKNIHSVRDKINNSTKSTYDKIDEYKKEKFGYAKALNLILFPCYLALVSAIWSCSKAVKFVQKKKAKPKEKLGLLIPLAIGLCLAFLPLLVSTAFMSFAGVTNVACGTIFKDDKGILPRLLTTFEVETKIKNKDVEFDLLTVIQECSAGKPLIAAVNGSQLIAEDLLIKQFDIDAKRAEMKQKLTEMSFGLPTDGDWQMILDEMGKITASIDDAESMINDLGAYEIELPPPATKVKLIDLVPAVKTTHGHLKDVVTAVSAFETECKKDIEVAKKLKENEIKLKIVQTLTAVGPDGDMLDRAQNGLNQGYLAFRSNLLEKSTSCKFLFDVFTDVGSILCDQALGGLNGVYAAIGLGVMSFFSATVGTVMIWHTLRAGKGQNKDDDKGGSDDSKEGKKKKDKKAKKSEGEEEETSPPPPANMAGKVGEQATPIGSDPSPQGGQVITVTSPNNPVVVAVPTDPAAPGEKTNPSLLPQDVVPDAGAPAADAGTPSSPIQMVPIEVNQEDNPKSQTGPQ
ncbi:hypothetical protein PRIPAC_77201 [Pristionchus pacificus]|nr:hypothetical protein PRIPAC_77201 [Pristionchus pacificus]